MDECMAVMMYAPRSYTREDVAELQLHGGVYVARKALQLCYGAGARPAEPGEFTRRAFENGRIDLAEAEAVMGLISATGEKAARAAMRQLEGGASVFIRQAQERLYALAAGVEAALDYPEEVDEEEATRELAQGLEQVAGELEGACDERAARILESGLRVTLCGRPNVGKSSLLNALLGEERAIVTEVAGTTRDVITGEITLGGMNVRFFDTAGLHDSGDQVERIGMERAEKALREADVVLLTLDASRPLTQEDRGLLARDYAGELLVLLNKSDLPQAVDAAEVRQLNPAAEVLTLSAVQGESLAPLKARLTAFAQGLEQSPLTQQRHLDAARRAVRRPAGGPGLPGERRGAGAGGGGPAPGHGLPGGDHRRPGGGKAAGRGVRPLLRGKVSCIMRIAGAERLWFVTRSMDAMSFGIHLAAECIDEDPI